MTAALVEMNSLEGVLRRLRVIQNCPLIVHSGPEVSATIAWVRETGSKLDDALRDLTVYLQGLKGDVPTSAIPVSLIDEISKLQSPLLSLSGSTSQLEADLRASSYPVIVEGMLIFRPIYHAC